MLHTISASCFFYALSVPGLLNISLSCYFQTFFVRFFESDSFRFKLSDMGYNFLLFVFVPEAPIFWAVFLVHTISCLGLEGSTDSGLTKDRTGSLFLPPYLLFLAAIYPYFNTFGHSAAPCSFPCVTLFQNVLPLPFILSFPQPFSHVLIPSIRPFLCPSQTIYQEWHLLPFSSLKLSPQKHLQHKTPEVESKRRRVKGENQKRRMKDLGEKRAWSQKP